MVGDYISREAAIQAVFDSSAHTCKRGECFNSCNEAKALDSIPTADAAPVRHGGWEWDRRVEAYRCSSCKRHNADRTAYCPNCGADLREDTM